MDEKDWRGNPIFRGMLVLCFKIMKQKLRLSFFAKISIIKDYKDKLSADENNDIWNFWGLGEDR